jgi:hypothetical protein
MFQNKGLVEQKLENVITNIVDNTITELLLNKYSVIIDNTHLKYSYIKDILEKYNHLCNIRLEIIDVGLEKAIEQNSKRPQEKVVPTTVVYNQYNNFTKLLKDLNGVVFYPKTIQKLEDEYNKLIQTKNNLHSNSNKKDAIIVDIDGTLAVKSDQRDFYEWDKVDLDLVNYYVKNLIDVFKKADYQVVIVSGRDEISRDKTQKWLNDNDISYDNLLMRKHNDFRKDTVVKKEIYSNEIHNTYNVFAIFDDRLSVIEMWNNLGLYVFNCNIGNKNF